MSERPSLYADIVIERTGPDTFRTGRSEFTFRVGTRLTIRQSFEVGIGTSEVVPPVALVRTRLPDGTQRFRTIDAWPADGILELGRDEELIWGPDA